MNIQIEAIDINNDKELIDIRKAIRQMGHFATIQTTINHTLITNKLNYNTKLCCFAQISFFQNG